MQEVSGELLRLSASSRGDGAPRRGEQIKETEPMAVILSSKGEMEEMSI